jgi:hypothetical protein
MPPRELTIHIQTPTMTGAEPTTAMGVDRDVEFDDTGLPLIRRHRISARLRDSALLASASNDHIAELMLKLIGTPRATDGRRTLVVGHARPDVAVRSAAYHGVTRDKRSNPGRAQHLIGGIQSACTVTVISTALDEFGAPVPASLREERALRPGLVLHAPLRWRAAPTDDEVTVLARCVLTLQQIGAKGSRGLGEVECSLDGNREMTRQLAWRGIR